LNEAVDKYKCIESEVQEVRKSGIGRLWSKVYDKLSPCSTSLNKSALLQLLTHCTTLYGPMGICIELSRRFEKAEEEFRNFHV
jgi:hypothetical protein